MAINAAVYTAVRVKDETLERNGQVGTYLGPAMDENGVEIKGESAVKFESDIPGGAQVVETFEDASIESVH